MRSKIRQRKLEEKNVLGLCWCGRTLDDNNFKFCKECRAKSNDHLVLHRVKNYTLGLCLSCGFEKEKGREDKLYCVSCQNHQNKKTPEYMRNLRIRRANAGLCTRCGREAEPGRAYCTKCREYRENYARSRKATNVDRKSRSTGTRFV